MQGFPGRTVLSWLSVALSAACAGAEIRMGDLDGTAHETYAARLREAGLHTTALGRDWLDASARALAAATDVSLPHHELRYLDPQAASAVAFRVPLEDGQRFVADVEVSGANPTGILVFLDLFYQSDSARAPQLVATADSARWHLDYVVPRAGGYLLRIQPELLRGGRVSVRLAAEASLEFPVAGGSVSAVRDRFGVSRDAGQRAHDGLDLLAPLGTPVLAAAAGRVTQAGTDRLGGNVVWLLDETYGRRLYYAHLDRHAVDAGARVEAGDTLGFVGTSGNAQGEQPHLHFGVYRRGRGAIDPYFHLYDPPRATPPFVGDRSLIGRTARAPAQGTALRARPDAAADVVLRLAGHVPLAVLGGSGQSYFVRTPDGRRGYVGFRALRPLAPLRSTSLAAGSAMWTEPRLGALVIDSLERGRPVTVLGHFDVYALVAERSGMRGWIRAAAVDGPAASPGGGS